MMHDMKRWYGKLSRHLPDRITDRLETSLLHPVSLLERAQIRRAKRSGPPYKSSHRKIIIDITASCDLHCFNCNRSCGEGQAASSDHMSMAQIDKFIRESIARGRRWEEIALEGGEPTLHPDLTGIIELLLRYQKTFSPRTHIQLLTNGYGERSKMIRNSLRQKGILVRNTQKTSPIQTHHCAFNIAPCDTAALSGSDFSQGCFLPACYGLGLTRYGYYPHPICGGIDRVFGFNIGRKHLPPSSDSMQDQYARLCTLCGYFRHTLFSREQRTDQSLTNNTGSGISASWKAAYLSYQKEVPVLELY